jgi:hypothetical protein
MRLDPDSPEEWALYTAITNAWSETPWNTPASHWVSEAKMLADGFAPDVARREAHWPPLRSRRRGWFSRLTRRP